MNGILVCQRNIKVEDIEYCPSRRITMTTTIHIYHYQPLQVGRPSQMPQAQACIDEIMNEAKEYNRWVECTTFFVNRKKSILLPKSVY